MCGKQLFLSKQQAKRVTPPVWRAMLARLQRIMTRQASPTAASHASPRRSPAAGRAKHAPSSPPSAALMAKAGRIQREVSRASLHDALRALV